jgi:hypothetical protein
MRSKHPANSDTREIAHPVVDQARPQRRNFLLALGAGGASAAIVAARALTAGPVAPDVAHEPAPDGKGYALTDHVRRYYRTAKI